MVTRLLVLGVVRIFAPVHGYFVRRELLSWHAEDWANLNPGSVYNALRSLERDGYLQEVASEPDGGRPARTTYELTADGEAEFLALLRQALWTLAPFEPANLLAAWNFAWVFKREEVTAALEHRVALIAASGQAAQFAMADVAADPNKPAHVVEAWRMTQARLQGEANWAGETLERLRAGEFWFAGEPGSPTKPQRS